MADLFSPPKSDTRGLIYFGRGDRDDVASLLSLPGSPCCRPSRVRIYFCFPAAAAEYVALGLRLAAIFCLRAGRGRSSSSCVASKKPCDCWSSSSSRLLGGV